jgi:glycosyltransferase involved in cell wall biosynthesis
MRVIFLMEQHIGHFTYYQNLRRAVEQDARVQATWVPITYAQRGGFWERLKFLPPNLRGTLRGRAQARTGLACEYDIAFCNTQVPAALAGEMIERKPYVISTDITPIQYDAMGKLYHHRADRLALLREYKHRANVRVFRHAARVLPWSTWTADSLMRDYGVAAKHIQVIPPGVDTSLWKPISRPPNQRLQILFIGGDLFRKGGKPLLGAFAQLPRGIAELNLVTRVPAPTGESIKAYHGMRANSPELIAVCQACDLFVLPTEAEAFGIAAIEASAIGMPVIASQIGGLTDVVAHGETGFLAPPGDAGKFAEYIRRLADDPALRQQFGAAARARVLEKFDAQKNAARVIEILFEELAR